MLFRSLVCRELHAMGRYLSIVLFPLTVLIFICAKLDSLFSFFSNKLGELRRYLFSVREDIEEQADSWIQGYLTDDLNLNLSEEVVNHEQRPGKLARHVAARAYFQFGVRNYNKSNKMVTRKWIRNFLDQPEFKDLRLSHKIDVIDEALALSFVPSKTWDKVEELVDTEVFRDHVPHEDDAPL